ncbi:hypothetical protein CCR75_005507 [Bremia lactucae]|uniref:Uncharacterized protein n=1 Tax=Bremia lactucae TaxID=4779 RepID=A0A976IJF6_BRELC|nr:hypothetical protein CCR75_003564 [Bremia lactucae]TDH72917.1 hypothetical protein CCR75_005507 [Bremia lactucae]
MAYPSQLRNRSGSRCLDEVVRTVMESLKRLLPVGLLGPLVALKQKEGAEEADCLKEQLMEMPAETELVSVTEDSILQVLRLRHVATPAPENCLALAVVQALANDDLAQAETILNRAATCVKQGFKYTGQLQMTDQFDHAEH